jgi:hypothetical protein
MMSKQGEVHVDLNEEQWATVKAALEGEVTDLRAENARLQERVEEAETHDCGYALTKALEIAERQMALAERRKEVLPDPDKLRLLADWFDGDDVAKGRSGSTLATLGGQPWDEVQRELRRWADAIARAAIEEGEAR